MKAFTDWEVTKAVEYVKSHDIESVAEMLLFVLGFKYNLCGTKYLKQGIVIRYGEENSLCKDLYNKIALHFCTTACRVERSIRHSICECYNAGHLAQINNLFRCHVFDENYAPTNSQFISAVCTWIHLEKLRAEG